MRLLEVITTTWENLQIAKHKSASPVGGTNACLICALWSADFLRHCLSPRATSRTITFLFPIVFGINLIPFFDGNYDGAATHSIICFSCSSTCRAVSSRFERVAQSRTSSLKSLRTCQPKHKNVQVFEKNPFWKYVKARFDKKAHDKNVAWR